MSSIYLYEMEGRESILVTIFFSVSLDFVTLGLIIFQLQLIIAFTGQLLRYDQHQQVPRSGRHSILHTGNPSPDKGSPPLSETVSVNVTILDINDNTPVFSESIFTVTVSESLPVGSRFLNVTASDADIGDNALLTWSIMSGNTGDVMAIEPSTGKLYNVGK